MKISMEKPPSKPQKTTALDFALSSAKILFLVVGIASTLFLISTHIQRFVLSFSSPITWNYPDFSRLSSTYLFIIVHFIILIIWKLNANHLQDSTQDSSDFYSSPSISRKSSIEDVLVSQQSSESTKEFRTTSQEIPVPEPEPVLDIHTVESVNGKNRTAPREIPEPVLDIHTVESMNVKSPPAPTYEEYSDDMKIDEEDDYSDSLDATWQAIIQKQLEKGDSWEKFNQQVQAKLKLTRDVPVPVIQSKEFRKSETFKENEEEDTGKKEMRKSKTFRENGSSIGWRGRNVWVEKDETFRSKVEAFIKMNYDQRLKKQGSNDNCRVEMVNTAY